MGGTPPPIFHTRPQVGGFCTGPRPIDAPMSIDVILGPPAAGKSTYVAQRFQPGDVVVDWDRILVAMTMQPEHTWTDWACPIVEAARAAMCRSIRTMRKHGGSIYIVACRMPDRERAEWARIGARFVVIDTPAAECERRILADPERAKVAGEMIGAVDRWWHDHRRR